MKTVSFLRDSFAPRTCGLLALAILLVIAAQRPAAAQQVERMYFPAVDNFRDVLVDLINQETERIDIAAWYLTDGTVVNTLLIKHAQRVPIRLIGDRGSIFEIDLHTKNAYYELANAGVPIRLRFNPTWFPEIAHWKAAIFVGQGIVTFGSANYTPFELAPDSPTNYKDETVLVTDDLVLFNAFKTKFDQMWNDTTVEPLSRIGGPPYLKNWHDACAAEPACSDFDNQYPNPAPMIIDTARLEPNHLLPPDMVWGQGPPFNNRLIEEINNEPSFVDFVIYRLTVDNITQALLDKHASGIPVRIILEPNEYENKKWPEFWLTHANMDKLWAAGVPIKERVHIGLTHMKMLVTSDYATNASSNLASGWQRDHNYFVPAATKPHLYNAMRDRFNFMWNATSEFAPFTPDPPDAAALVSPANGATGVTTTPELEWQRAAFAVSYDVYLGTSSGPLMKVANVPAALVNDPPPTYSWTPATPLQSGTTYFWKVESRTNATHVNPSLIAPSPTRSFTTTGSSAGPPVTPSNPSPSNGASGVSTNTTLTWQAQTPGTTYRVAFGTSNPPAQVATGLSSASYSPGQLNQSTTYYWRVTAVNSAGTATGPVWSFTTGAPQPAAGEIVIYAADITTKVGNWAQVNDATAAAGVLLRSQDQNYSNTSAPLPSPPHYFEATFNAVAGTKYRVWTRMRAKDNSKWNDSVFVQFSDSVTSSGSPIYRIGTTSGLFENLWTCSTCQTFGWGWSRHAYWLNDTGEVWFQNSGTHTIRIQTREDGVDVDQIVISPVTYVNNAPGPVSNDSTIVAKPGGGGSDPQDPPAAPASPSPANGATTGTSVTLTWSAAGATSYDVYFGSANPPSLAAAGRTTASYPVSGLNEGVTYYWKVVARNDDGTTTGPVWSFTTGVTAPQPPSVPSSPSPANGATTGTAVTLSWSAAGATSYDVYFGSANPPALAAAGRTTASYPVSGLGQGVTYYWKIVARNDDGNTSGPVWSFTTATTPSAPPEIVIYANDIPATALHGAWAKASDPTSPNGVRLGTPDNEFATTSNPIVNPTHYVDVSFSAPANVPYRIWLRLKATANSKWNDAVWAQFSDARHNGASVHPIGTTQGLLVNLATDSTASSLNEWGWHNSAYWLNQVTTVTFATSGTHTLRIQVREDGVMFDQIVLSPADFLETPPGPVTNDATIVPKP